MDAWAFIVEACERHNITLLALQPRHAAAVGALPFHHKDPFDRMLVAQAMIERMPIVTPDPAFRLYPAEVLWS